MNMLAICACHTNILPANTYQYGKSFLYWLRSQLHLFPSTQEEQYFSALWLLFGSGNQNLPRTNQLHHSSRKWPGKKDKPWKQSTTESLSNHLTRNSRIQVKVVCLILLRPSRMQSTATILLFFMMCLQQASVGAGKSALHFSAVNTSNGWWEAYTSSYYAFMHLTVLLDCGL